MLEAALLDAGLGWRDFIIVSFPINLPERYQYYVPLDAVFFLTIYDDRGRQKLQLFREMGLATHVLWTVSSDKKGISAADVRDRITTDGPWVHLVPACIPPLVDRCNLRDRLQRLCKTQ